MTIEQARADREMLIAYLNMMVRKGDWHGVRDACVDIETIESRWPELVVKQ